MKAYRAERGLTQEKLAEMVDSATNYIAQIENGKRFPTDTMLEKIATALHKSAYELFTIGHYEKKTEKDWQTQVLTELEHFIHASIVRVRGG